MPCVRLVRCGSSRVIGDHQRNAIRGDGDQHRSVSQDAATHDTGSDKGERTVLAGHGYTFDLMPGTPQVETLVRRTHRVAHPGLR